MIPLTERDSYNVVIMTKPTFIGNRFAQRVVDRGKYKKYGKILKSRRSEESIHYGKKEEVGLDR